MARISTQEHADRILAAVRQVIESGDWQAYLRFTQSFHNYSPLNRMLIFIQCEDATHVAGYRDWQGRGRQVRKGEKAIRILAPMVGKAKDDDGSILTDEAGEPRRRVYGFREVSVFDVSQTDGDPLPENPAPYSRLTGDAQGWDALVSYVEANGGTVTTVPSGHMLAEGDTNTRTREIRIVEAERAHMVAVLAHECAHLTLHMPDDDTRVYVEHRGDMEVEAEAVAYIVCQRLGLDTGQTSTAYLAGWASSKTATELRQGLDRITTGADAILDHLDGLADAIHDLEALVA